MTGIIDVGGGLRGAFGTGIFDRCLEENINFEYLIGVSAGAANIASYLGGQKGRNLTFYTEYSLRPEYMSFSNLLHNGSYLDLSYVYGVLSNSDGEDPLNYEKMAKFKGSFLTVATDALTGKAIYFTKDAYRPDDYRVLMASCCLPVACRPVIMNGVPCFDGGVADPVPVRKALSDGCDKIILILTRPVDEIRVPGVDKRAAAFLRRKYPAAAVALESRYQRYNVGVEIARFLEKEGRALILSPDNCDGLKTLTKDTEKITNLYKNGYKKAEKLLEFIR
ncbi:MAG: patatin family protein [Clostridia bacterium]|nr:patatin family protein [Clostridia bacterium]